CGQDLGPQAGGGEQDLINARTQSRAYRVAAALRPANLPPRLVSIHTDNPPPCAANFPSRAGDRTGCLSNQTAPERSYRLLRTTVDIAFSADDPYGNASQIFQARLRPLLSASGWCMQPSVTPSQPSQTGSGTVSGPGGSAVSGTGAGTPSPARTATGRERLTAE